MILHPRCMLESHGEHVFPTNTNVGVQSFKDSDLIGPGGEEGRH